MTGCRTRRHGCSRRQCAPGSRCRRKYGMTGGESARPIICGTRYARVWPRRATPDLARIVPGHGFTQDVSQRYVTASLLLKSVRPLVNAVWRKGTPTFSDGSEALDAICKSVPGGSAWQREDVGHGPLGFRYTQSGRQKDLSRVASNVRDLGNIGVRRMTTGKVVASRML